MGHSPDHFAVYVWLAGSFQAFALLRLTGGGLFSGWVLQCAAAHCCLLAGVVGHSPMALVVGAVLMAIVAAIPFRFAVSWRVLGSGVVAACVLAAVQIKPWLDQHGQLERGLRANSGDKWYTGDNLRIPQLVTMLKPHHGEARMVDFAYPVKLQWPAVGRSRQSVIIENAGPASDWQVWEGQAEIHPGPNSQLLVRCDFPASGGQCRIGPKIRADLEPRKVLVLGGLRGDLDALDLLLDQLQGEVPDAIFLCGDMTEKGRSSQLLALRDRIDAIGSRMVAIPGEAENFRNPRSPYRTWLNARSVANASVFVGGVSALLFDASQGGISSDSVNGMILHSASGVQRGFAVTALHRPLIAPEGREDECLGEGRELMLKFLEPWGMAAVFSCTDDAAFDLKRDGVHHISVGGDKEEVAAAMVTLDHRSVSAVRWLSAKRQLPSVDSLRSKLRNVYAYSMEFIELTHDFMRGLGWGIGAIVGALLHGFRRRRRSSMELAIDLRDSHQPLSSLADLERPE